MSEYKVAGKGLRFMFLGSVIAAVGWIAIINPVICGIASIVGALMVLYGLYQAMPAHPYYKLAMLMELVGAAVGVLRMIFKSGLLGDVVSIVGTLAALLSTVFVCKATGELLSASGADPVLAEQARLIVLLYALCAGVSILCTLVSWVPILNILAAITGAVTSVVMLAANVLKVFFYFKSSRALLA